MGGVVVSLPASKGRCAGWKKQGGECARPFDVGRRRGEGTASGTGRVGGKRGWPCVGIVGGWGGFSMRHNMGLLMLNC